MIVLLISGKGRFSVCYIDTLFCNLCQYMYIVSTHFIFSYVRYITYFINYWLHVDALRLKPSFNLPVTMIHIKYCWNMQVLAVNLCEQDLGVKAVVVKPKWWGGHSFFFRIGGGVIHFFGGLVGGHTFF